MTYRLEQGSDEAWMSSTREILRTANRHANAAFYQLWDDPATGPQPLNVFAFDDGNQLLGGLLAETHLLWLRTSILAVRPEVRRMGIGRELMSFAEAAASKRGCKFAYVDTMEYQAPDFYRKLGYESAGTLPNWDSHGNAKWFFIKTL
jgi:GNAT superfamily N-acetyltransferase